MRRNALRPIRGLFLTAGALLLALSHPASAQELRGRVLDDASGAPVVGALLAALGPSGEVGGAILTDRDGAFALRTVGDFVLAQLRLERIGYETRVFAKEQLPPSGEVALRVATAPVSLPGVEVVVDALCGADFHGSVTVQAVWDEARKALEMTALSQRDRVAEYELERTLRLLDPSDLRQLASTAERRVVRARIPYGTISAAQMTETGWVERLPEGDEVYYAPDADLLLSPEFAEQHCFGLESTDQEVVLRFVPNRTRSRLPDIRGRLFLDRTTGALGRLEFEYVGPRVPTSNAARPRGEVHYYGAPNGVRVVREWAIRVPVYALGVGGLQGVGGTLSHLIEEGGRVERIRTDGADVALESVREAPLLPGPPQGDPDGLRLTTWSRETRLGVELEIANDGELPARVTRIQLERCSNVVLPCEALPVDAVVEPGERKTVMVVRRADIAQAILFDWAYAAEPAPPAEASLRVRVVDAATGAAIEGARIVFPDLLVTRITGADGVASVSGMPPGRRRLEITRLGFAPRVAEVSLERGGASRAEYALAPQVLELAPVTVTVDAPDAALSSNSLARSNDFYVRYGRAPGVQLNRLDIERAASSWLSQILDRLPGVALLDDVEGLVPATTRGGRSSRADPVGGCPLTLYVNGARWYGSLDALSPDEVEALEVYSTPAEIPVRFSGTDENCGVVLIWTQ